MINTYIYLGVIKIRYLCYLIGIVIQIEICIFELSTEDNEDVVPCGENCLNRLLMIEWLVCTCI
jgi:hypothetical protein